MIQVALIAPGAMGSALGRRLVEHGVRVTTSLAGRSGASADRARAAGMEAVSDQALMEAEIFLSVVPPGEALRLAQRFAPLLAQAPKKPVYADCNAVNPETVRRIAEAITATGADFVDAGIIGLPPRPGTPGPAIYCSGPAAAAIGVLARHGLRIREVEGAVGAASALKMSYAGITKGLIAVASAMALGATRAGVEGALVAELAESQPQLLGPLQKMVPDVPGKAWRWVAEMEEIAGFLDGVAGGGALYQAVAELYRHLAAEFPNGADVAALRDLFRQP
jgi:3-hydroxyisobutyrate dehydrogenase-like beta-hydroxyacid dehydrogenase